jgi:hypothetical protein
MRSEWASDTVIEEILRDFPEQIQERRRKLADAEWCERHPEIVKVLHDPVRARALAQALKEQDDPFSRTNLEREAANLEWRMLNTTPSYKYVIRDPATGEVIDEEVIENDVDPSDPYVRAYVAQLN